MSDNTDLAPVLLAESVHQGGTPPPYDACRNIVVACGDAVAGVFFAEKGRTYELADTREAAEELIEVYRTSEEEPPFLGSALLGARDFLASTESFKRVSKVLCQVGDDYFYDQRRCAVRPRCLQALYCYQLAAGLDPENTNALWEAVSVCWQGAPTRFKAALPYAVVLARLEPGKDEVASILGRIRD